MCSLEKLYSMDISVCVCVCVCVCVLGGTQLSKALVLRSHPLGRTATLKVKYAVDKATHTTSFLASCSNSLETVFCAVKQLKGSQ